MQSPLAVKAMRIALRRAKSDYDAGQDIASVIAYLSAVVQAQAPAKPAYRQLPMFAIPGRPAGKLKCKRCRRTFGDTNISPKVNWRMYLVPPTCPHCGCQDYTDTT